MKKSILIPNSTGKVSEGVFIPVVILLLFLVLSGNSYAAVTTQLYEQQENSRMLLLEKLEKGQKLSSEEIRAGLKPSGETDDISMGFELPELPDFPQFPGHPDIFINPPHIYISPDFELDQEAIRDMKKDISRSLEEMKREIESVIHSEEMLNFQREMKEWGEEIRREIEKAVREMKTEKEVTLKIEGVRL